MIQNPQQPVINEGTAEDRRSVYRTIKAFGVLDIILGISLLACGVVSDYYSGETFGPPFYTGCFIAGTFVFLKGIFYISWAVNKTQTITTGTESCCTQWTQCLCALCMLCFFGCIFGIMFIGISGIFDACGPTTWWRKQVECYNNYEEKRYLAIATVALLSCCFLLIITTIGYMCCNAKFDAIATVARIQRNTISPGRQMEIAMRNQMQMQQMAASQDQRFGGYQPASQPHGGVQVGAVGIGYPTDQNYPQGYSQLGATSTQAPNTGYAIGQSSPQGYSQYGTTTPQHQAHGPHNYTNSPPKSYPAYNPSTPTTHPPSYVVTPTAPPPSYDEIMKQ